MISLCQDPLTYYLEVVVLTIRPFPLVSFSPIDEIFWVRGTLKLISAGIGWVWNITKGYEKNMAYFWSGGRGGTVLILTTYVVRGEGGEV